MKKEKECPFNDKGHARDETQLFVISHILQHVLSNRSSQYVRVHSVCHWREERGERREKRRERGERRGERREEREERRGEREERRERREDGGERRVEIEGLCVK